MTRYTVSCFGPPSQLKIKRCDEVNVTGWANEKTKNMLADSIENLTEQGPTCECERPTLKAMQEMKMKRISAEWTEKKGTVGHVTVSSEFIEFELEVPS